jgi:hypothetical protein
MNTKIMVGVSVLISFVYVVVDEIAVNYMLAAANGAVMGATKHQDVDLVALRRQAQAAMKDLRDLQQLAGNAGTGDRTQCRDQAWPYYSGDCLAGTEERQVRMVSQDANGAAIAAAPSLVRAANF